MSPELSMNPAHRPVGQPYRRIVLCADDFGMSAAVNAGILDLADRGRLSGASILVDGPAVRGGMAALLRSPLQLGLHLNFTETLGDGPATRPLGSVIVAAYLGRLPADAVFAEVRRQLDGFAALTGGRTPDYVDGHQHVHQLPVIRRALLRALSELPGPAPWIRHTGRPRLAGLPVKLKFKAAVIAALGARGLAELARDAGFAQNPGFLGVYDFQGGVAAYEGWMRRWLAQCRDGDVLMCHPALGEEPGDPLSPQRQAEHAVLAGPLIPDLLARRHFKIAGGRAGPEESS